jgi:hypothetical protein
LGQKRGKISGLQLLIRQQSKNAIIDFVLVTGNGRAKNRPLPQRSVAGVVDLSSCKQESR